MPTWRRAATGLVLGCLLGMSAVAAHSAPKTVLVLGDSLSAEYGLARGTGWVNLLQQRLKAQKNDAVVVNASISGDTTSGGKSRLPALLAAQRPAIVIIELGANDALRGLQLSDTKTNLLALVGMAQKAHARVLLVGMQIPPNYGPAYTRQFTAVFPAVASQTKSALAPFLLEGIADKPELFQADRLHPLAQAHPAMLNNVWPSLLPLLNASRLHQS
ncbi:arylesterase [Herbaspirillum sp. RTI4]|uniref:arylesterase n=1 Tax=Herbaspirillum sp. RTI4 TaxID=3048640 RepID=UPI002AB4B282|nr:arylesterase [Herbaspirillum sp. RTI4]MDY7579046.1 arylesterase [Herbaspirillum sp. RTI4]MEA9982369.1 arylesterase [Herbaspirillum sp. RTI4]